MPRDWPGLLPLLFCSILDMANARCCTHSIDWWQRFAGSGSSGRNNAPSVWKRCVEWISCTWGTCFFDTRCMTTKIGYLCLSMRANQIIAACLFEAPLRRGGGAAACDCFCSLHHSGGSCQLYRNQNGKIAKNSKRLRRCLGCFRSTT